MRSFRPVALAALVVAAPAVPAAAQQSANAAGATASSTTVPLVADLLADIAQAETKFLGLARAIPAEKYGWKPAEGVRSVGEVLMHVAADNYLLPAVMGHAADPATGVTTDYKTAQAFEQRKLDKDATIAELERSFAHLKQSLTATPAAKLGENVSAFGQSFTTQRMWILTATHLHEHLGQLVAYARSTGVVPPWSQGS